MRSFLYDIVNNARSGLDVDKLDYFKRWVGWRRKNALYRLVCVGVYLG